MGAWIETDIQRQVAHVKKVAPYVGAWIETQMLTVIASCIRSHPTWVRGLKLLLRLHNRKPHYVAPYVGAWIETLTRFINKNSIMSHPTWVRGLKLLLDNIAWLLSRRTLRGCVD